MNRRDFLRCAAAAASAPIVVPGRVLGRDGGVAPSNRIALGQIGFGWIGGSHLNGFLHNDRVQYIAACDCFEERRLMAQQRIDDRFGGKVCKAYRDFRVMLERSDLDAVVIAVPDHWHAIIAITAAEAGKDIYCEKPMTLTVEEGRVLERAVHHYKRVLQCGSQMASMPINNHANRLVREGALGKLKEVSIWNLESPERWVPRPAEPMPDGLDWDAWCNQTPLRPYHSLLHKGWARWRDYDGGGLSWGMTGWGCHTLDQVHRGIGTQDTGPVEIHLRDRGPDSRVTMRYPSGVPVKVERTLTRWPTDLHMSWEQFGCVYIGEEGVLQLRRGWFRADPPELMKDAPEVLPELQNGLSRPGENRYHIENFLDCMRTRKKPNADVETAHRASTACFIVNMCRELQRDLKWDPKAEKFTGDDEANMLLSRPRREGYELPRIG